MLSSSHPMRDVCGELAKADFYGLDPGGYSAGEKPFVPHQNRNVGGIVAVILRVACNYTNGRTVIAEVEFDATGKGTIRRTDDSYIREVSRYGLVASIGVGFTSALGAMEHRRSKCARVLIR